MALLKNSKKPSSLVDLNNDTSNNSEVQDPKIVKKVRFQIGNDSSSDEGIVCLSSDPVDETVEEVRVGMETESVVEKPKKKKSDKCGVEPTVHEEHHKPNACRKKRKKKKEYEKKEKEELEGNANESEDGERKKSKKKKKKKSKVKEELEDVDNSDDSKLTEIELPKKKKAKKKKTQIAESESLVAEESDAFKEELESDHSTNNLKRQHDDDDSRLPTKKQKTEESSAGTNANASKSDLEVKTVCKAFVGSNLEQINGYASPTRDMGNILKKYKKKRQM